MSSDWFRCVLFIPFYVAKVFSESVTQLSSCFADVCLFAISASYAIDDIYCITCITCTYCKKVANLRWPIYIFNLVDITKLRFNYIVLNPALFLRRIDYLMFSCTVSCFRRNFIYLFILFFSCLGNIGFCMNFCFEKITLYCHTRSSEKSNIEGEIQKTFHGTENQFMILTSLPDDKPITLVEQFSQGIYSHLTF